MRDPPSDLRTRQIILEELCLPPKWNTREGGVPLLLHIINRLSDQDRALVSTQANVRSVEGRQVNHPGTGTPSLSTGVEAVEVNAGQEPLHQRRRRRCQRAML